MYLLVQVRLQMGSQTYSWSSPHKHWENAASYYQEQIKAFSPYKFLILFVCLLQSTLMAYAYVHGIRTSLACQIVGAAKKHSLALYMYLGCKLT